MTKLPISFISKGFSFTQLLRSDQAAIYGRAYLERNEVHYEVIAIRHHKGWIWPNGNVTPPGEGYPGSEQWGLYGWTFSPASHRYPFEAAKLKFDSLSR